MSGLTIEHLREAMALVARPPLYYLVSENIERGILYHCKEQWFNPELIVLHPDDLDKVKAKITARTLVPLADELKEEAYERLRKQYPLRWRP
jgi:hypothetical protein